MSTQDLRHEVSRDYLCDSQSVLRRQRIKALFFPKCRYRVTISLSRKERVSAEAGDVEVAWNAACALAYALLDFEVLSPNPFP